VTRVGGLGSPYLCQEKRKHRSCTLQRSLATDLLQPPASLSAGVGAGAEPRAVLLPGYGSQEHDVSLSRAAEKYGGKQLQLTCLNLLLSESSFKNGIFRIV